MKNGLYLPKYMAEHLYMFSGESVPVTFRMKKSMVDVVKADLCEAWNNYEV